MGILSMIAKATVLSTAAKALDAGKSLVENTREGMEKIGQVITGKLFASDIIKRSKKKCLIIGKIINPKNSILSCMKSIFVEKYRFLDYYYILDCNNTIKYKIKYKYFFRKLKSLGLYDENDEKVGYIDLQNLKKVDDAIKIYSLYMNEKKMFDLKKYKSSNNIYASMEQGKININYNNLNAYEFKFQNKIIGKLYITRTPKNDNYVEKYVLEYENKENEPLGILISVAIDCLNH